MAKEAKTPEAKAAAPAFKYTLADLETATGLKGASLRAGLRAEGMTKAGAQWGWNTKAEFDAIVKTFKERAGRAPAATAKPATAPKATGAKGKASAADAAPKAKGKAKAAA